MTISIKSPTSTTGSIQKNGSDVLTFDSSDNVTVVNNLSVSGTVSSTGDINFDSGTLYVDSTNNRVGIGTSSPNATFHVENSSNSLFISSGTFTGIELQSTNVTDISLTDTNEDKSWIWSNRGNGKIQLLYEYPTSTFQTRLELDTVGNFKFNSGYGSVATAYGCRAWVNFNGQGTVAIRASGNVSSITDIGTGRYTVNFTTSLPDTNYSWVGTARRENDNTGNGITVTALLNDTKTTSALSITTVYSQSTLLLDVPEVNIMTAVSSGEGR